ncbi:MAG: Crp/Fnr family transcriptional regulator [Pseudomonadota bacterium]
MVKSTKGPAKSDRPEAMEQTALGMAELSRGVNDLSANTFNEPLPAALVAAVDTSLVKLNRGDANLLKFQPRQDIVAKDRPSPFGAKLVSGWVAVYEIMRDGGRSLMHIYVPGDVIIFRKAHDRVAMLSATALSEATLRTVCEDEADLEQSDTITRLLANERALLLQRIAGLGRRDALARLAALLSELDDRMTANVGGHEVANQVVEFPLTQTTLADLLGLTSVHVNRSLARLREMGAIEMIGQRVRLRNRALLRKTAYEG